MSGNHKGIDWDSQPLGLLSDTAIAERLGCNPTTVARVRYRRGIPAHRVTRKRNFLDHGEFLKARAVVADYLRRMPGTRETCVDGVASMIAERFGVEVDHDLAINIIEVVLWHKVKE